MTAGRGKKEGRESKRRGKGRKGEGRWLPGEEWGVWMEPEWDGVGSSYPSTSTGDPTSQAGAKLEVER